MRSRWVLPALAAALLAGGGERSADATVGRPSSRDVLVRPGRSAFESPLLRTPFEVNRGQFDPAVRYAARCGSYSAYFTGDELVLSGRVPDGSAPDAVRLRLASSRSDPIIRPEQPLPSRSSYFIGDDPSRWVVGVEHFGQLRTSVSRRGADVSWHIDDCGLLAFEAVLAPGVAPPDVRLDVVGAGDVAVEEDGSLAIESDRGRFHLTAPRLFQVRDGIRETVEGGFVVTDGSVVSFWAGDHDRSRSLVIDPAVSYASYLGGSVSDNAWDVAVDSNGVLYVTGNTGSSDFPTQSAYQSSHASAGSGSDAYIAKFSANGSSLSYATFVGGNAADRPNGIVVDSSGQVIIAGLTSSSNFPLSSAAQSSYGGGPSDVYVVKLSANGASLSYSTYLGGASDDYTTEHCLALDSNDAVYVAGWTRSTDFPTTSSAVQTSKASGSSNTDLFATKFTSSGTVAYSTYFGGTGDQSYSNAAVDSNGLLYMAAWNDTGGFPATTSAYQTTKPGGRDVVIVKLNASGSSVVYSGYLGGTGTDEVHGIAVDAQGALLIAGNTGSSDFPVSQAAYQSTLAGGGSDGFVARLSADGATLTLGSYLGGSGADGIMDVAVDAFGQPVVVGSTESNDLPTSDAPSGGSSNAGQQDAFAAQLNVDGDDLVFSQYIGGSSYDAGQAVTLDGSRNVYVAGQTSSTDFPTSNAYQSSRAGGNDAFVVKLAAPEPPDPPATPEDLSAAAVSDARMVVTWTDVDSLESSFELQRAIGAGAFSDLATMTANTESYSDETVSGGTTYRYRVRAVNDVGASDWSSTATATTPSPPPSSVGGSSPTNRSVTITWQDDADDETGYIVERALGCPGVTWSVLATLPPDSTSYTDNTVQPETDYSYRVRTMGSDANSGPSLEVCITTGPANPTSLLAITQSDTAVLLRWSDNSSIETGYEIERTPAGGAAVIAATAPGNASEYSDAPLAPETEYTYRVRTVAVEGTSSWSPSATTRTAPAAPSSPFGEAVSSSRVRLSWTDESQVEQGFEIRRRIHGEDVPLELIARLPTNTTSFVDEGLLQETAYDYTVNAYDGSGDSNPVAVDELKTTAVLVIGKIKTKGAKGKKPAAMQVQADIDFGGYRPQAADGATIRVGEHVFTLGAMTAKKKGKLLAGEGDGFSFSLSRTSDTASRGKLKMTITGPAAEVAPDAELTLAFATGGFQAAGTLQLAGGGFAWSKKKRSGLRIDPEIIPTKLSLKLGGLENDTLQLGLAFESRTAPEEQPNALVTVGDTRLVFAGVTATQSGEKVTYRIDDMLEATLVIDYAKGTLSVKARKLELGEYPKGDVPTLLDVIVGDLRWRDVPVLGSSGKRASY